MLVLSTPSCFSVASTTLSSETTSQHVQHAESCCGIIKEGRMDTERRLNREGIDLNKLADVEVSSTNLQAICLYSAFLFCSVLFYLFLLSSVSVLFSTTANQPKNLNSSEEQ